MPSSWQAAQSCHAAARAACMLAKGLARTHLVEEEGGLQGEDCGVGKARLLHEGQVGVEHLAQVHHVVRWAQDTRHESCGIQLWRVGIFAEGAGESAEACIRSHSTRQEQVSGKGVRPQCKGSTTCTAPGAQVCCRPEQTWPTQRLETGGFMSAAVSCS